MKTFLIFASCCAFTTVACSALDIADTTEPAPQTETNATQPAPELKPVDHAGVLCKSYCAWEFRCPEHLRGDCAVECDGIFKAKAPKLRSGFVKASAACFDAAGCGDRDACFYIEEGTGAHDEEDACTAKRTACGTPSSFPGEYCGAISNYNPETRAAAKACLVGACDDVPACLRRVLY